MAPGFCAVVVAKELEGVRQVTVGSDGIVYGTRLLDGAVYISAGQPGMIWKVVKSSGTAGVKT